MGCKFMLNLKPLSVIILVSLTLLLHINISNAFGEPVDPIENDSFEKVTTSVYDSAYWITNNGGYRELKGDITGSDDIPGGEVDMRDIAVVSAAFGARPGDPNWNTNTNPEGLDLNGDQARPPENATIIQGLEPISFQISLYKYQITVDKAESLNVSVRIYSTEKVDLLLSIGTEHSPPPLAQIQPILLPEITAHFSQNETIIEPNSEAVINLEISIGDQAISGTYELQISATQRTEYGSKTASVPLELNIP